MELKYRTCHIGVDPKWAQVAAVIVLYQCSPLSSETIESLNKIPARSRKSLKKILLFDNSPNFHNGALPIIDGVDVIYEPHSINVGVGGAYRYASKLSILHNSTHYMLLDQDTILTRDYFEEIERCLREKRSLYTVFLPTVVSKNRIVSPVLGEIRRKPALPGQNNSNKLIAINSGMVLDANTFSFFNEMPVELWLDGVDHWIIANALRRKVQFCVLNSIIKHSLSVSNSSKLSDFRATSILNAEKLLFENSWSGSRRSTYPFRLVYRLFRAFYNKDLVLMIKIVKQLLWLLIRLNKKVSIV